MTPDSTAQAAFAINNVRRFIAFRIFFNARFYYPVFTVLFLDFGLTLAQFSLLNAIWAATIVLFEVPSGALADIIGRRNLLVTAGALMVLEIGLLCVLPPGQTAFLFPVFCLNRILSGIAEAAASGSDEALAYDSLARQGDAAHWPHVLERQMRYNSAVFMGASLIGAAVFDAETLNRLFAMLGWSFGVHPGFSLKAPLYLTFIMSLLALYTTLKMDEAFSAEKAPSGEKGINNIAAAFQTTLSAGGWIWRTPLALMIILGGLSIDHVARTIVTLTSEYYRLIGLPEVSFGLLGSVMAVTGLFIPRFCLWLGKRYSPAVNFAIVCGLLWAALVMMSQFWAYIGLLPCLVLSATLTMASFFVSHYLNEITGSSQRATVLSFKGLSFNLAYGLFGLVYAGAIEKTAAGKTGQLAEDMAFKSVLGWFDGYFLGLVILVAVLGWLVLKKQEKSA